MCALGHGIADHSVHAHADQQQTQCADNAGQQAADARNHEERIHGDHGVKRSSNNGKARIDPLHFVAESWEQLSGIRLGAREQYSGPLPGLRQRQINVGFVDSAQVHATDVAGDADDLAARDEGVFFPRVEHRSFFEPDLEVLADGVFTGPEAASGCFADNHHRRLPLGFAGREDTAA